MKANKGQKFELKTMSLEELNYALDWAADEGFNPGVYDAECFYKIDPKGFFIGELWGRPIGCIASVKYSDDFGFIGLFFMEDEFRKQWFGTYLARTALNYQGKRNICFNGMTDRIDSYQKMGFKTAYRCLRFETKGKGSIIKSVVDASDVPFEELVRYDAKMFSVSRPEFLRSWLNQPESGGVCVYEDKIIKGFGVIRRSREGYRIGPLFADTEKIADTIFIALSGFAPNEKIYIDIPEVNKHSIKIAEEHNMRMMFETIRMYSNRQPKCPEKSVYGLTSIELG